jgi:hypothetical protein
LAWLLRCFSAAAVILALGAIIVLPGSGQAQGGEEELRRGVEGAGAPSTELESDDPADRNLLPLDQADELTMDEERARARRLAPMQQDSPPGAQSEPAAQAYGSPLVIPAAEFAYAGLGTTYRLELTQGYVRGGPGCGMAPLYLPGGARVTAVWSSMVDNDGATGQDAWVYVYRLNHFSGATQLMAFISTAGYTPSTAIITPADLVIDYARVDHLNYSYYAYGCVQSANTRLYSLRVFYVLE